MTESEPYIASDRPVYAIGAVARMVGVEPATLRSWEDRYGLVVPARGRGSQRVYSRQDIQRLAFVVQQLADGATASEAHRMLAEKISSGAAIESVEQRPELLVLLADRDRFAVELVEFFLQTEGYRVVVAWAPDEAEAAVAEGGVDLSVVELVMHGGFDLCRRMAEASVPVLAISSMDWRDEAFEAGASAFLRKPLDQFVFVSTVRDLLRTSALTRPQVG